MVHERLLLNKEKAYQKIRDLQRRIAVYEDESAYKELFFQFFNTLTRFSTGIVHSGETAEEIVSDVFIQLWKDRTKLEQIQDLQLYLFIAVKNNSLRASRQQQKKGTLSVEEMQVELESTYLDPAQKIMSAEALQSIHTAINNLPPRAKLIFKLAKEDKMRYKDIANLLDISVKTVDNQLSIAIRKIAVAIGSVVRKKS
ncbi:MAG: RNA polymerase sigma-70 factor [Chitinophagaceae bacterium]|nr:RNA polymerase sigma-70 factor [Chitinophagaceae bacterium]